MLDNINLGVRGGLGTDLTVPVSAVSVVPSVTSGNALKIFSFDISVNHLPWYSSRSFVNRWIGGQILR